MTKQFKTSVVQNDVDVPVTVDYEFIPGEPSTRYSPEETDFLNVMSVIMEDGTDIVDTINKVQLDDIEEACIRNLNDY